MLVADAVITADRNKDDDHDDQDHDLASKGALCRASAAVACSRLVLGLREGLLVARRVRSSDALEQLRCRLLVRILAR